MRCRGGDNGQGGLRGMASIHRLLPVPFPLSIHSISPLSSSGTHRLCPGFHLLTSSAPTPPPFLSQVPYRSSRNHFPPVPDYPANSLSPSLVLGKLESSPHPSQASHTPYSPATNTNMDYLPWHAHITALTVAPHCRRLGHARKLSAYLERQGELGKAWFVDLFVRVDNVGARGLYESMGYVDDSQLFISFLLSKGAVLCG